MRTKLRAIQDLKKAPYSDKADFQYEIRRADTCGVKKDFDDNSLAVNTLWYF